MNRYAVFSSDNYYNSVTEDYIGNFNLRTDIEKLLNILFRLNVGEIASINGCYPGVDNIIIVDCLEQKVVCDHKLKCRNRHSTKEQLRNEIKETLTEITKNV